MVETHTHTQQCQKLWMFKRNWAREIANCNRKIERFQNKNRTKTSRTGHKLEHQLNHPKPTLAVGDTIIPKF